jgi:multiple sugar transport system permease protein
MLRSTHREGEPRKSPPIPAIAIALVITLFPVYWIASNSFKFDIDIFAVPPELVAGPIRR